MKKIIKFLYIPFTLLLITACSDSGIFYSLEKEEKVKESNNLNNEILFSNMVSVGTANGAGTSDGYYFGNAGSSVFYRSEYLNDPDDNTDEEDAIDNWKPLTMPAGPSTHPFTSDATNSSMVLLGNNLYISRITETGSYYSSGIYQLPGIDSITDFSTVTSGSWLSLAETTVYKASTSYSYNVYKLHTAGSSLYINRIAYTLSSSLDTSPSLSNSQLFVTTDPGSINNQLADSNTVVNEIDMSGLFVQNTQTDPANPSPVKVEIQKISSFDGTNYWMILNGTSTDYIATTERNGKILLSTADNRTFFDATSLIPDSADPDATRFADIFEYANGVVLVSDLSGNIYTTNDSGASTWKTLTKSSVGLFNGFSSLNDIAASNVIVGSAAIISDSTYDGTGYYQLDLTDTANIVWNDDNFSGLINYNSTDLSEASIKGFLYGADNETLFSYTMGYGVWMNTDGNTEKDWSHE